MKIGRVTIVGLLVLIIGVALTVYALMVAEALPHGLIDKNGDGVIDWHDADVNNDGKVNILDTMRISLLYGQTSSNDPNWAVDSRCDLNGDNIIDTADYNICASFWGSALSWTNAFNPALIIGDYGLAGMTLIIVGSVTVIYEEKVKKRHRRR